MVKWDPKPKDRQSRAALLAYVKTFGWHLYQRRNNRGFGEKTCLEKNGMPEYHADLTDPELVAGLKKMLLAVLEEYGVRDPTALDECGKGTDDGCIFRGEGEGSLA
jgi:hypothetical protein